MDESDMEYAESLWPGLSSVTMPLSNMAGTAESITSLGGTQQDKNTVVLPATSPLLENTLSVLGLGGHSFSQPPQTAVLPVFNINSGVMTPYQTQLQSSFQCPAGYVGPGPSRYTAPGPGLYTAPGPSRYTAPGPGLYTAPGPGRYTAPGPGRYMAPGPGRYVAPGPTQSSSSFTIWFVNPHYLHLPNNRAGTTSSLGPQAITTGASSSEELSLPSEVGKAAGVFVIDLTPPSIGLGTVEAPITVFHLFSELPFELRAKIWNFNLPDARVIEIKQKRTAYRWVEEPGKAKRVVFYKTDSRFVSNSIPPLNLYICGESRAEACLEYELAFPTTQSEAQTYVNFKIDTIIFDNANYFPRSINKEPQAWVASFAKIRSLTIDMRSTRKMCNPVIFKMLSSLVELDIAVDFRSGPQKADGPLMVGPFPETTNHFYSVELPMRKAQLQEAYDSSNIGVANPRQLTINYAQIREDFVEKQMILGRAPTDVLFGRALKDASGMYFTDFQWKAMPQPVLHSCGH